MSGFKDRSKSFMGLLYKEKMTIVTLILIMYLLFKEGYL